MAESCARCACASKVSLPPPCALGQAVCRLYLMAALSSSVGKLLFILQNSSSPKLAMTLMSIHSGMEKES